MPVITPAYPSMCATFNITRSSMTIIQRELRRGLEISEQIMVGKRPWSDLFVKHTFFTSGYRYYISVVSASKDKEAHKVWSGYVESKVRMLVQKLEQHPSIALAHAFNKGYDRRHLCKNEQEIGLVQEGSLEFMIKDGDESKLNGAAVKTEKSEAESKPNGAAVKAERDEDQSKLSDVPMKAEHDEGESKLSEVPIKTESKDGSTESVFPVEVYTTTHYIGLELEEGMFSLHPPSLPPSCPMSLISHSWSYPCCVMLILQAPNLLIYRIKSMSSRYCALRGKSIRMTWSTWCLWVSNTFESKSSNLSSLLLTTKGYALMSAIASTSQTTSLNLENRSLRRSRALRAWQTRNEARQR